MDRGGGRTLFSEWEFLLIVAVSWSNDFERTLGVWLPIMLLDFVSVPCPLGMFLELLEPWVLNDDCLLGLCLGSGYYKTINIHVRLWKYCLTWILNVSNFLSTHILRGETWILIGISVIAGWSRDVLYTQWLSPCDYGSRDAVRY